MNASIYEHLSVVEYLILNKANVNAVDSVCYLVIFIASFQQEIKSHNGD